MKALYLSLAMLGTAMVVEPGWAQSGCEMSEKFDDPHPVLHDENRSMFWVRPLEVNADGARRAYHRDDPHGNKGLAIEYIGNGMTIMQNGKALEFVPDEAKNEVWLKAYRSIVANGWKSTRDFEVDIYGFARDGNDNVCVRPDGRLIAATSLVQDPKARRCDPKRYIDAIELPGIVVPNKSDDERSVRRADREVAPPFAMRGVRRGDLAVVFSPETAIWKGAFLYDTGPRHLLGEGSLRLVLDLRGSSHVPTSALETNDLGIEETYTVLFPGTARQLGMSSSWSNSKIQHIATELFKRWGGGTIETALNKLQACAQFYKNQFPDPKNP